MSAPPATTPRRSLVDATLAADRLGTLMITGHALSGSAPLTVVAAGATVAFATGHTGMPWAYVAVAAVLAMFATGFVAMARRELKAGAFYTYIARGLGPVVGVGAALIALVGYSSMEDGLYGGFGAMAASFTGDRLGISWPWHTWALIAWAVVALFGILRIDINGAILGILLAAEVAIIFVYDVVLLADPGPEGYSLAALSPKHTVALGFGAMAVIAVAGYTGWEATTVFAEEARDPKRTIARATYLTLGLICVVYAGSSWAMTVATGPSRITDAAATDPGELMFRLTGPHMAAFFTDAGRVLLVTSLFAALLAFHNTVSRYLYALGRERVLPAFLGRTGLRTGAPVAGSLTQSAVSLAVIVAYAVSGTEPMLYLFFWLTTYGGLAVLVLMMLTCVAILVYFTRYHEHGDSVLRTVIAPVLAFIALGFILWETLTSYESLLGVEADHPAVWMFPAGLAAAGVLGMAWALYLRLARPRVYRCIGLGVHASTIDLNTDE